MPQIYVCFLWHMHQPYYKDLVTGEYHLPWTRLHALKDYYGMVKTLEEFPEIRQTFNLVPSMMEQIREYAAAEASDPFLRLALKPAGELTEDEQAFVLRYFFQAQPDRLIRRFPRYGELFEAWLAAEKDPKKALAVFAEPALRDLQVLSQVAWFEEESFEQDAEVKELVGKGRNYTLEDQRLMGAKQLEMLRRVLPAYEEASDRGQIEISTTPYYHPILPLIIDSDVAREAHPGALMPSRFRYPGDARWQLAKAREYVGAAFGKEPDGLWPSEGSVSNAALEIAAEAGFRWAASDNGVLSRTIGYVAGVEETYRPYVWRRDGREVGLIFRDHYLSDLVGFVYSRMGSEEAAKHLIERIVENCAGIVASGRDALVPIVLDGENAWEHYERNGRPFLREVYRRISGHGGMRAVTVSEALKLVEAQPLDGIAAGSWINANFDVWIGHDEDNQAWELLLRARQAYGEAVQARGEALSPEQRALAWEELMIAEGSDWCWWYGPQHYSENREEFDRLYRAHLANVYRALDVQPPEELGRPIIRVEAPEFHENPLDAIHPVIDGQVTSYFEWMAAGKYHVDERQGAMHGQRRLIQEMWYGRDRSNIYLRFDFTERPQGLRMTLNFGERIWGIELEEGRPARIVEGAEGIEAALGRILEVRVPAEVAGPPGEGARLRVSVWLGALPLDALPAAGWLMI